MAPSRNLVFEYVSVEMPSIIEASIIEARRLGNTQVTPLHVIERIKAIHRGLFCGICVRCKALDRCINNTLTVSCIPGTIPPKHPALAGAVVMAIRTVIESFRGRRCYDMKDVEKLFEDLLEDPTVTNVMREAGFYITILQAKLGNRRGSVSICHV